MSKRWWHLNWSLGRQGSGYKKCLLLSGMLPLPFDVHILRFDKGTFVNWHRDPVTEGVRHFRLNIILSFAEKGGVFLTETTPLINTKRVKLFRPDITDHAVSRVMEGTRYVLSIGWLLKEKEQNKGAVKC